MENRKLSEYYEKIGLDVIAGCEMMELHRRAMRSGDLRIIFLESDRTKSSACGTVYADCRKVPDSDRWAIDADFVITVYTPNVEDAEFTDAQKRILIMHELLHVGLTPKENGGWKKFLVPHSIQEFYYIARKYGPDWNSPGRQLEFSF